MIQNGRNHPIIFQHIYTSTSVVASISIFVNTLMKLVANIAVKQITRIIERKPPKRLSYDDSPLYRRVGAAANISDRRTKFRTKFLKHPIEI